MDFVHNISFHDSAYQYYREILKGYLEYSQPLPTKILVS